MIMNENKYYDGTKLLSMMDLDGNKPELYLCTSNRTAGKTTYFNRLMVNKFLKENSKFALIYRFKYELSDVADKFFKDIGSLFFDRYIMRSKSMAKGIYHELFLCDKYMPDDAGKPCGYALALNAADQIKKYSHLFSDIDRMLMDEFQSETNSYCTDEITKFQSLHTSIARGQGKQTRYVPVYMISNPVSIINPYYTALDISSRLKEDTHFLKGHGFVLEQGYNASASEALKESGFNKAFAKTDYVQYSAECVYLNDNQAFIEKPTGTGRYLGTINYMGTDFDLREFAKDGIIYCDDRPDKSFTYKIAVTTDDHQINYVMLKRNDMFIANMRLLFERGCFRFKDLRCKEAVMKLISY